MERTLETRKKSLGRITQHEVLVILLFLLLVLLLFFQVRYWPLIGPPGSTSLLLVAQVHAGLGGGGHIHWRN